MKLDELALNPLSRKFLESYATSPGQGLLLSGPRGIGLRTTATALAHAITAHPTAILSVLPDEKGTITIERVRALYAETRSVRSDRFVVLIDTIENMRHEAQNAFLKLLEEPVENVYFLVTAHEPQLLLPTILSRVQHIELGKLSAVASESLLRARHITTPTVLQQMLFIASGLPAELTRLAENKEYFEEQAQFVRQARDFLTAGTHERLSLISKISGREDALMFVSTIASVLCYKSERDPTTARTTPVDVLETVISRLQGNGHVRTQLMYLALNVV